MRIAYFGDEFSHTYAVASAVYPSAQFFGFPTIRGCADALLNDKADLCVVPVENSVEGAVNETLDILRAEPLYIEREFLMPIKHCLIGAENVNIEDISAIYSHYQALSQCRSFLDKSFPLADILTAKSTSDALNKVKDGVGAIARRAKKGQKVLLSDIQDYKTNTTVFLSLRTNPTFEGNKCRIMFETLHEPGALLKALNEVAHFSVNLTKIESRPQKTKLGRYVFFADFDFDRSKQELTEFLSALQVKTASLKFLGKYTTINL